MKILYYRDIYGNFGDDINEWMWEEISPIIKNTPCDSLLLGVGSIINTDIIKENKVIVFGSGVGYGNVPKERLDILCVRGKLTANILKIKESFAVADSAILLRLIPYLSPLKEEDKDGVLLIPHHNTFINNENFFQYISEKTNIKVIDPSNDSKCIVNQIRKSKLVITEAMHGAIIADTMRVRWIPVVFSHDINTFKWLDYLSMFDIDYSPIYLGLPDIKEYYRSKFKIKYNLSLYKKDHEKYKNINELLSIPKPRGIFYKLDKKILRLKLKLTKKSHQIKHLSKIINKLNEIKNYNGSLSNEEVFNKNFETMKSKLKKLENELTKNNLRS